MVGEDTVPQADHVVYFELLTHQKHKPAQTVELGI